MAPWHLLGCVALMNLFSAGFAWALADDLVMRSAQGDIGRLALCGAGVLTACQGAICLLKSGRLVNVLLQRAAGAVSLVWFFVCGILPLWWMDEIEQPVKGFVLLLLAAAASAGAVGGARRFRARWQMASEAALAQHYDRERGLLDWDALSRQLAKRAGGGAALPRQLGRPAMAVIAAAVVFMLVVPGYFFGAAAAAAIAWGGMIALGLRWSVKLIGATLAQVMTVLRLERRDGVSLAAYPEGMPRKRSRQGQRRR